jgi:hypothetical protein
MFCATSKLRASSRVAMTCAAVLAVSGLAVVGVKNAQPAAAATPDATGYQNIRINEITSDGTSKVELYNVGATTVDIVGWLAATSTTHNFSNPFPGTSPVYPEQTIAAVSTPIPAGGFFVFTSTTSLTNSTGEAVLVLTQNNTIVDRVDWSSAAKASPSMARCGGDGYGQWVTGVPTTAAPPSNDAVIAATFGNANVTGCPVTLPKASLVAINEVTSTNPDTVEFFNSGSSSVDLSTWKYIDGDATHSFPANPNLGTLAFSTTNPIPAGGYAVYKPTAFGLGDPVDSFFLLDPSGTTIDSVTWFDAGPGSTGAAGSYERCADVPRNGVTWFQSTVNSNSTFGSANSCVPGGTGAATPPACTGELAGGTLPPAGVPLAWPGSPTATVVDNACQFLTPLDGGEDVSGLAFDPASNGTVLWAVQNKEWLWKLTKVAGKWVPDTTWVGSNNTGGKEIFFAGGVGKPDSEGLTVGPNGHIYATSERDNSASTIPLDTILEYDPTAATTTLSPIHEYDVTSQFPQLQHNSTDANLGFEGVGFVPDTWLVNNGWVDPLTGRAYNPAMYPRHGSGLFFAGLEKDGTLHVYGLNTDGSYISFGSIATGQSAVMDVFFDSYTQRLVATCDNTCSETHTLMKITNGNIVADTVYKNPSSMPINYDPAHGINQFNNFEGFAISPVCTGAVNGVGGTREALWSDDGNYGAGPTDSSTYEHALWGGTFPC